MSKRGLLLFLAIANYSHPALSGQIVDLEAMVRDRAKQDGWLHGGALKKDEFETKIAHISFQKLDPLYKPKIIASTTYNNDTDGQGSETFMDSKTTTDTYTHATTDGIQFGGTVEASFKWPIFGVRASATFTHNLSTTDTKMESQQQVWNWNVQIPVPKRSRVVSKVIVQEGSFNPKFEADACFTGSAVLDASGGGTTLVWKYDLGSLFTVYPGPNVKVIDNKTICVHVKGTYSAVLGANYVISTKQYNLVRGSLLAGSLVKEITTTLSPELKTLD